MKRNSVMRVTQLALLALCGVCHAGDDFFSVPDFKALPPDVQVVSEKTEEGVRVTELFFAGAPFNGQPTRIYGFYCRPEKDGKYPGVLEIHGAGLKTLGPRAGIEYAKNGFCCFVMDWAGKMGEYYRKVPRRPPYSEFEAAGKMLRFLTEEDKKQTHPGTTGPRLIDPAADSIRNGVLFARRAAMFLKSRPEVDPDKLCVSGMSAGGHLTLLILGVEPSFKVAAVKYGNAFIRDLPDYFGGYFGAIKICPAEAQDAWLARFDPKHNIRAYRANVLMLSGTDDRYFRMPLVLATWRAIPTDKRLIMLPNDNHSQVGNVPIPLAWFKSNLGLAPAWPVVGPPEAVVEGETLKLTVAVSGAASMATVSFWVKRMPRETFYFNRGRKDRPETHVKWQEVPASPADGIWSAAIPALKPDEQLMAYAMVEDENGAQCSSDTVEVPDYPQWRALSSDGPWEQSFKAADFKKCEMWKPGMADEARRAGNLRGLGKNEKRDYAMGWYEYELWVPRDGWYEVIVPGGRGVEYFIDRTYVFNNEDDKVGSFWLEKGMRHTIRLQRYHRPGMPAIEGFTVKSVAPDHLAGQLRVTVADGRTLIRRGEPLRLVIETAAPASPIELGLRVLENQNSIMERRFVVPDTPGLTRTALDLVCDTEGAFRIEFTVNGDPVDTKDIRPILFNVVDTAMPEPMGAGMKRRLLREIDCVKALPDFQCGETCVSRSAAGAYRESGNTGFLSHMNSTDPTWFAYRVEVPEKQTLYQIEVDYPDDALRTYLIAIREDAPDGYPTAGGVDSGGEFSLSNRMLTHSLLHWARSSELRVLIIPALDKRRAAAASIRVYRVDGDLPPLDTPAVGGRRFANWYEEGSNFLTVYGRSRRDSMSGILTGADRWAQTIRHMGGDTLWMTMVIYQFGLYPTKYNLNYGGPFSPDLVRAVLMKCEKYGMDFIGEFCPVARELDWPLNANPGNLHRATSKTGAINEEKTRRTEPTYNPLWPKNQEWYLGMIGEFVDRYRDSPALKGVCLRLRPRLNSGLNNFHNLDWGYDDYTIGLFEKERGAKIPVDPADPARFLKRYDWLMANARTEWIEWRCDKIAELYARIATRVRQARPDLFVLSNYIFSRTLDDPREAGIDPLKLQAIPGVILVDDLRYGRSRGGEMAMQEQRDDLLDPSALRQFAAPDGRCSFINATRYFEATGEVVPPEALGFSEGAKRGWMSGVVNPAGRHANERWAVQLAETDTAFLADGGNAYTVGQPILREFLREYRALPNAAFTPRADARDPVAVWEGADHDSKCFYAVNRERYPVKVQIALQNTDTVERLVTRTTVPLQNGILAFELEPYALRTFRTASGAAIASVTVEIPPADRQHAENLVSFLDRMAADAQGDTLGVTLRPDELKVLETRAAEARNELSAGHLWRVRTLAEHHALRKIYSRCKRQPPNLRETGVPSSSDGDFTAADLHKTLINGQAELGPLDAVWPGETLLLAADPVLTFELDIPFDAKTGIAIGQVAGGGYGPLELSIDGQVVGVLNVVPQPASPHPALARLDGVVTLRQGKARLSLRRLSGDRTAIRFVSLSPVFTDIVSGNWRVTGPFAVGDHRNRDTGANIDAAMRTPDWRAPEVNRDPGALYEVSAGVTCGWIDLDGTDDFIDLGRIFKRYSGTISYGITTIHSSSPAHVRLLYGMDYWMKIWVNGVLVRDVEPHRGAPFKGQFHVDIPLQVGANEVLVKVGSGSGGNGFWMAVSDPGDLRLSQHSE